MLEWSLYDSVQAIFEQDILTDPGFYVLDCQGPRSLGTIIPSKMLGIGYEPGSEGNWDYRLTFMDSSWSDLPAQNCRSDLAILLRQPQE